MATKKRKKKAGVKKPETAGEKKPETAAVEMAKQLFTHLQNMIASPGTLSSAEVAEFQKTLIGVVSSASLITKMPLTGNGAVTTSDQSNGYNGDMNVQYLEYKNSRLKDLIIDILMRK